MLRNIPQRRTVIIIRYLWNDILIHEALLQINLPISMYVQFIPYRQKLARLNNRLPGIAFKVVRTRSNPK